MKKWCVLGGLVGLWFPLSFVSLLSLLFLGKADPSDTTPQVVNVLYQWLTVTRLGMLVYRSEKH